MSWKVRNPEKIRVLVERVSWCKTCDKPLRADNIYGFCSAHVRNSPEHREKARAWFKAWAAENREYFAKYDHARRAQIRNQFVEHVEKPVVWERDGGICHICNKPAERATWHLDHVVPLSRGGEHSYANTAVSHPYCNISKKDKLMEEIQERKKRRTDYTGDRFGDWVVMSKAPAVDSKRMWNVTNSQTDEVRIVAQTALKDLASDQGDAVPNSNEITANVLAANGADNPFKLSAAAFEPVFREAAVIATVSNGSQTDTYMSDGTVVIGSPCPFASIPGDIIDEIWDEDLAEIEGAEEFVADWVAPKDDVKGLVVLAMQQQDALRDTLDQILKAAINL